MTYPKDHNGRYLIPSRGNEPRVEADCSCGDGWYIPTCVWDYISQRHAAAHTKGRDGLPAASRMQVRHIQPGGRPGRQVTIS
jgi:hypothetical protein